MRGTLRIVRLAGAALAVGAGAACDRVSTVGEAPYTCAEARSYRVQGTASWYGSYHHGRRTANGEVFNMNAHTAAHRRLPFGTRIRVQNLANGNSVVLVVNDRGPFIRGRILDVSRQAAEDLGFLRQGLTKVRITTIETCREV
jgi:rare lipoprotein A